MLILQFLSKATNQHTDEYGGSIKNRARLLFEILEIVKEVWPANRIGIIFTPAAFNPGIIKPDEETIETFDYLLECFNGYDLAYVHFVGPVINFKGTVLKPTNIVYFEHFRNIYKGNLITNLGFTQEIGNQILSNETADLISFGTLYVANPDLVRRFDLDLPLCAADPDTCYSGEAIGYTDYLFAL